MFIEGFYCIWLKEHFYYGLVFYYIFGLPSGLDFEVVPLEGLLWEILVY